jgi:transposase
VFILIQPVAVMVECKNCGSEKTVKSGQLRGKQRYKCKQCKYFFVEGDQRTNKKIAALKALCVLFYAIGKGSYGCLGKIFDRDRSLVYRWIKQAGLDTNEPIVSEDIKEMEFDEMWHFVGSKKTSYGSSKPLTVAHGELWPGCLATVILQLSDDSIEKFVI